MYYSCKWPLALAPSLGGGGGGCIIELPQVFVRLLASLARRCFAVWMDARAGEMRTGGRGRAGDGRWKKECEFGRSLSNFNISGKSFAISTFPRQGKDEKYLPKM